MGKKTKVFSLLLIFFLGKWDKKITPIIHLPQINLFQIQSQKLSFVFKKKPNPKRGLTFDVRSLFFLFLFKVELKILSPTILGTQKNCLYFLTYIIFDDLLIGVKKLKNYLRKIYNL